MCVGKTEDYMVKHEQAKMDERNEWAILGQVGCSSTVRFEKSRLTETTVAEEILVKNDCWMPRQP